MKMPDPDRTLVVATSGGKDSAAMALWLKFESGLPNPLRFVFNDTGHEHPMTLQWLDGTLAPALGQPIERTTPKYTFQSLCEKKGRFPSARARFCTQELKIFPMQRWIAAQLEAGELVEPVLCQGVRAGESLRRSKMDEWDNTNGDLGGFYDIWRPVLRWSEGEVFAAHRRHGLDPNPLYLMGAGRVGCWPCIHVRHGELRNAFRRDAELLPRLLNMEQEVNVHSKRGVATIFAHDKVPKRWHDRSFIDDDGAPYTYATIQAVHDYLLNPDQADMFADEEGDLADVPTCMSQYGLCE